MAIMESYRACCLRIAALILISCSSLPATRAQQSRGASIQLNARWNATSYQAEAAEFLVMCTAVSIGFLLYRREKILATKTMNAVFAGG